MKDHKSSLLWQYYIILI